ncbi:MAG: MFS transporter, partial [Chloroflexi bacterium]|nr:MFS transporter [Chloroflexota bacterium]
GEVGIGNLIAIAGLMALVASIPAGIAADRIGRKRPLIAGLVGTALGVWLMAGMSDFSTALLAVVVFGLAEAFATGTIMVYAMDLAPEDRRGAFLGAWQLSMNVGQMAGPLAVGAIADARGFAVAFVSVAAALVAGAVMIVIFGTETRQTRRYNDAATPPSDTKPDK